MGISNELAIVVNPFWALRVPDIRSWLVTWGFAVARSGVEAHVFEPGSCHNRAIEATRKLRKAA